MASAHIDLVKAAVLGFVEGLTEFLPVSSTGHLLLMEQVLGWGDSDNFGKSFAVLIQLGAILALLTIYFGRLWALARNMFTDWAATRFVIGVLLAFLPAAVIGALTYHIIKTYLFDVRVVCISLIIGGFILFWVDRLDLKPRYHEATGYPLPMYFIIGIFQCFSMIPGVSRAGATIVGAMLCGADRRSAAEFSFWLAMPTMVGAFAFEAFKNRAGARARRSHRDRGRLRVLVHLRLDRGENVSRLRAAPLLRAVCLVAYPGRHHRHLRALFHVNGKRPFPLRAARALYRVVTDRNYRIAGWLRLMRSQATFQPYNFTGSNRYPRIFRFVQSELGRDAQVRILSFGCSTGEEVFSLRGYFPRAVIKGIDLSGGNIAVCRRRLRRKPDPGITFETAGSTSGEASSSYDAIFCMAVLRHGEFVAGR